MNRRLPRVTVAIFLMLIMLLVPACSTENLTTSANAGSSKTASSSFDIPKYDGNAYKVINSNNPKFTSKQKKRTKAFEKYSSLDSLGRCGVAYANICEEIMPTSERGDISSVHPSGWQTGVGYNRCHLIGYQLAGENANEENLITGTEYFNVSGMLPFENMIADYVHETGNHVLYRVTPIFKGKELVARGVHMEAWSVEDKGDGICFNVYCFNVFKGSSPKIDYKTGKVSGKSSSQSYSSTSSSGSTKGTVYWTPSGECYHKKGCRTLSRSTTIYSGTVKKAKSAGKRACQICYG